MCCPSHPLVARVHRCWWERKLQGLRGGWKWNSYKRHQKEPPPTTAFMRQRIRDLSNRFWHLSFPLICFPRGMGLQDAGTHQAEMPTVQDASGILSWDETQTQNAGVRWPEEERTTLWQSWELILWKHFCLGEINEARKECLGSAKSQKCGCSRGNKESNVKHTRLN